MLYDIIHQLINITNTKRYFYLPILAKRYHCMCIRNRKEIFTNKKYKKLVNYKETLAFKNFKNFKE